MHRRLRRRHRRTSRTIQRPRAAAGASQIIAVEFAEKRRAFAKEMGATTVINPETEDVVETVQAYTDGLGVDCAFECVGAEAPMQTTLNVLRKGGRAVVVGIFEKPALTDYFDLVFFDKQIIGSFAYSDDFKYTTKLLSERRLMAEPMITGRIGLDELVEGGFEELLTHKDRNVKILASPS